MSISNPTGVSPQLNHNSPIFIKMSLSEFSTWVHNRWGLQLAPPNFPRSPRRRVTYNALPSTIVKKWDGWQMKNVVYRPRNHDIPQLTPMEMGPKETIHMRGFDGSLRIVSRETNANQRGAPTDDHHSSQIAHENNNDGHRPTRSRNKVLNTRPVRVVKRILSLDYRCENIQPLEGKCPIKKCSRPISGQGNMKDHIDYYHHGRIYQCIFTDDSDGSRCNKAFQKLYNIGPHCNTHSTFNAYKCSTCQKQFNQKSNLNTHVKDLH